MTTLAVTTLLVALVSEIFVGPVQQAATSFGMTPAFIAFIIVALVGGSAEMASAFSGARKNRLDLSVGIALGSAAQIALFRRSSAGAFELCHRPDTITVVLVTSGGHYLVRRRAAFDGLRHPRHEPLSAGTSILGHPLVATTQAIGT